jgi:hypothetical protein
MAGKKCFTNDSDFQYSGSFCSDNGISGCASFDFDFQKAKKNGSSAGWSCRTA